MNVQELIDELSKIEDKTKTVYCDIDNEKQDILLPIFSIYDTPSSNINLATYI